MAQITALGPIPMVFYQEHKVGVAGVEPAISCPPDRRLTDKPLPR